MGLVKHTLECHGHERPSVVSYSVAYHIWYEGILLHVKLIVWHEFLIYDTLGVMVSLLQDAKAF